MNLNNSSMLVERKARDDAVGLFEGRAKSLLLAAVSGDNAAVTADTNSDLDKIIQYQQSTPIQTEKSLLLAAVSGDPAAVPGICLDQLPKFKPPPFWRNPGVGVVGCHGAKRYFFDHFEKKEKGSFYKPYCDGFNYPITPFFEAQNKDPLLLMNPNHEWFSTCCAWENDTCENKYPGMGIEPTTPTTTTPATTTSMTTATSKTNATTNEPTPTPTTPTPTTPTPTTPTPTTLG
eukprot:23472_1